MSAWIEREASPEATAQRLILYRRLFTAAEWNRVEPLIRAAMRPIGANG